MAEPEDHRPLVERARPRRLSELVGNASALRLLRSWAATWDGADGPPSRRAALLEGPPGVGKTTAALAIAADRGWSVVEMNASDARNQEAIGLVAGRAAMTHSILDLDARGKVRATGHALILLDEADCLTGRAGEAASRPAPLNFRDFVRGRYGNVEALAKAWGLGQAKNPPPFGEWADVPTTAGRGAWTKLPSAQRDIADWRSVGRAPDASDRGGLGAIARLVRETRQPLILTVNDASTLTRYSPLFRTNVVRIPFGPVAVGDLRPLLDRLVERERLPVAAPLLDAIARHARGDVRAALTDLEAIAALPSPAAAESLLVGRNLRSELFEFTGQVLTEPHVYRSVEIQSRLFDVPPDDLFPWIEENAPRAAPDAASRSEAIEVLARAERFLAFARRARVWSLWSYASELMTGGVSVALSSRGSARIPELAFPQFLGAMGRSRATRAVRLTLLGKVGARLHLSRRKGADAFLPFLDGLFRGPVRGRTVTTARQAIRRQIVHELDLTPEEVAYLLGADAGDAAVLALLEPAPSPAHRGRPEVASEPPVEAPAPTPPPADRPHVQRRLGEY
jgi:DNA polymerase III delta prime subunit